MEFPQDWLPGIQAQAIRTELPHYRMARRIQLQRLALGDEQAEPVIESRDGTENADCTTVTPIAELPYETLADRFLANRSPVPYAVYRDRYTAIRSAIAQHVDVEEQLSQLPGRRERLLSYLTRTSILGFSR